MTIPQLAEHSSMTIEVKGGPAAKVQHGRTLFELVKPRQMLLTAAREGACLTFFSISVPHLEFLGAIRLSE